jgi:hypothetical protein
MPIYDELEGIPLASLIGSPLEAACRAQAHYPNVRKKLTACLDGIR